MEIRISRCGQPWRFTWAIKQGNRVISYRWSWLTDVDRYSKPYPVLTGKRMAIRTLKQSRVKNGAQQKKGIQGGYRR